jgi:hypothetical protein
VRAYSIHRDPAYLFNAGQAYRNAQDCPGAHDAYKRFLDAVPTAPNAAEIRGHLATLAPCAKRPEPPPPKPVKPEVPSPPPRTFDPGLPKRIAGIATIATGALVIAIGGVFARRTAAHQRELDALCPPENPDGTCTWSAAKLEKQTELEDLGPRDRKLAIASFVIGGCTLAGGVVLYALGLRARTEGIAIVPTTDGAMAQVSRSF